MYYGEGITINDITWAPVNCGYEAANGNYKGYPYGKLYQWGRTDGCGYDPENIIQLYVTETLEWGGESTCPADPYKFYNNDGAWYTGDVNNYLWDKDRKGEYDPCPDGWRVPNTTELSQLNPVQSSSSWGIKDGVYGYWFHSNKLFLPAAGYRHYQGEFSSRDSYGRYWSSTISSYQDGSTQNPRFMYFSKNGFNNTENEYRANANSVRCVKE